MRLIALNMVLLEQVYQTMINNKDIEEKNLRELDNICDECKEKDESVSQNLILTGYKLCNSCRTSKTIFPI